ncbi:MAG TPA: YceD family protein [Rudaea sp.]|nr:YceD family protein [Rudaea sp.]
MNAVLPESVDAWRMVQGRCAFQGSLPLAAMSRLRDSLAACDGDVIFDLEFGKDELGVAQLRVRAEAALPLVCQRTLETFALPVQIDTRLGLISREEDEATLPTDVEPLLIANGMLRLADVVEDELILALPVVPVKPGTTPTGPAWSDEAQVQEAEVENPFAALAKIKSAKKTN